MDPKGGGQAHRYRSSIERHGQGGRRLSMKEMPRKTSAPNAYSTGTWSSATVRLVADGEGGGAFWIGHRASPREPGTAHPPAARAAAAAALVARLLSRAACETMRRRVHCALRTGPQFCCSFCAAGGAPSGRSPATRRLVGVLLGPHDAALPRGGHRRAAQLQLHAVRLLRAGRSRFDHGGGGVSIRSRRAVRCE